MKAEIKNVNISKVKPCRKAYSKSFLAICWSKKPMVLGKRLWTIMRQVCTKAELRAQIRNIVLRTYESYETPSRWQMQRPLWETSHLGDFPLKHKPNYISYDVSLLSDFVKKRIVSPVKYLACREKKGISWLVGTTHKIKVHLIFTFIEHFASCEYALGFHRYAYLYIFVFGRNHQSVFDGILWDEREWCEILQVQHPIDEHRPSRTSKFLFQNRFDQDFYKMKIFRLCFALIWMICTSTMIRWSTPLFRIHVVIRRYFRT